MSGPRSYVLCFAHADIRRFAGGLAKYIHEESAMLEARGMETVTVFPLHLRQFPRLQAWASRGWGVCRNGRWEGIWTWKGLLHLLGRWEKEGSRLAEIQLHHIGRYRREDLRAFLSAVPAPVRLFVHDFHTVCRSPHLMKDGKMPCGTVGVEREKCAGCPHWDEGWVSGMRELLAGLDGRLRVTAPSEIAAEIWGATHPSQRHVLEVVPHWVASEWGCGVPGRRDGPLRLAFAGSPEIHKGWPVWEKTVAALRASGNYEFLYFGEDVPLPDGVRGIRVDGEMRDALEREGADFLFLWSLCAETYSYVYYEALQAGTWVLAREGSGNVAMAVKNEGWGTVFPDEAAALEFLGDAKRVRETLATAARKRRPTKMVPNPRIADSLGEGRVWNLPAGKGGRSRTREILWQLKERTGHA